ncbi:LOW QUALITY PROTEIN: alpha-glucuronidase [Bacillus sp. JCM 19046]|nr:LOW QUALITY PROTEIN: alpha-glucuronidase [Bacillus sp. JCM 19046]
MTEQAYRCWLQYETILNKQEEAHYWSYVQTISLQKETLIGQAIKRELNLAVESMFGKTSTWQEDAQLVLTTVADKARLRKHGINQEEIAELNEEGYIIKEKDNQLIVVGASEKGLLYGVFHLLRLISQKQSLTDLTIQDAPQNQIRMLNQWDNIDGSIERGYSGQSIFYSNGTVTTDEKRLTDYARLLASVGINAISINNVNVWKEETHLISERYLTDVQRLEEIFQSYGVTVYLSINFASPIELGHLDTADPLDAGVQQWWKEKVAEIYSYMPRFGGFVVKADSEHRPGPFTYERDHADGANLLADALSPYNGMVIWRCFVYNCMQDWRDRKTDRARAAYDHFVPLDGRFRDNVVLQIKNGPMDFQVREPVSPLFGALQQTNQLLEFQITQEYLGQQKDLCYLVPMWKEVLQFDTKVQGEGSTVQSIVNGSLYQAKISGIAAVANSGDEQSWTGHTLAQANLFGYVRLTWNADLTAEEILHEWIVLTFGHEEKLKRVLSEMLLASWSIYENYTTPLGIGWMVNPNHHYGVNVDGYEYSRWGTYHFADREGLGVDRTRESGTAFVDQYANENADRFNALDQCPDDLLLFFIHVPYTHRLKNGKTVIQHYYDSHFEGVTDVEWLISEWQSLKPLIDPYRYTNVAERLQLQLSNAREWRDQVNTYFLRKSGIADADGRKMYE